jgi:hypothetical protein
MIRATCELILAYARCVRSQTEQDRRAACWDVEEKMAWGAKLLRGISDVEERIQAHAILGGGDSLDFVWEKLEQVYRVWAGASERLLRQAEDLFKDGFSVLGLSEFRSIVAWDEAAAEWEPEQQKGAPIPVAAQQTRQPAGAGERKSARTDDDKHALPRRDSGRAVGGVGAARQIEPKTPQRSQRRKRQPARTKADAHASPGPHHPGATAAGRAARQTEPNTPQRARDRKRSRAPVKAAQASLALPSRPGKKTGGRATRHKAGNFP